MSLPIGIAKPKSEWASGNIFIRPNVLEKAGDVTPDICGGYG